MAIKTAATLDHRATVAGSTIAPNVTTASAAVRKSPPNLNDVSNPATLHRYLMDLDRKIEDTSEVQRSHPEQGPVTFANVVCPAGGATVTLPHNLGRKADFIVVRWASVDSTAATGAGWSLVSDENDTNPPPDRTNVLVLKSYVAGMAKIRVF